MPSVDVRLTVEEAKRYFKYPSPITLVMDWLNQRGFPVDSKIEILEYTAPNSGPMIEGPLLRISYTDPPPPSETET